MSQSTSDFIQLYSEAISNSTFVKMTVSHPKDKNNDLRKFSLQLVEIKNETKLKCVYTHQTKDITKNYSIEESVDILNQYVGTGFKNAILYTTTTDYTLLFNNKMKARIMNSKSTFTTPLSKAHDIKKKRLINTKNNLYLLSLGVTNEEGEIKKNSTDKFKQINKYIETVDGILRSSELKDQKEISIVDMGSGKGYLTFALYDYLTHQLGKKVTAIGVEQRPDLVQLCNDIAKESKFEGLSFTEGSIQDFKIEKMDILIALHACDTATDDAIFSGIQSKASIIITAPCCHKQVRKAFNVNNDLKEITHFGILEERQAEILTDTIRALALEAEGYNSQVFEFIADAHTHKNVMVVGVKKEKEAEKDKNFEKIDALKTQFGVMNQHLEQKLRNN